MSGNIYDCPVPQIVGGAMQFWFWARIYGHLWRRLPAGVRQAVVGAFLGTLLAGVALRLLGLA